MTVAMSLEFSISFEMWEVELIAKDNDTEELDAEIVVDWVVNLVNQRLQELRDEEIVTV